MISLTFTLCFHISAMLGSNAPSGKDQESAKCATVHVERFAITFCWNVCKDRNGLWTGNKHDIADIYTLCDFYF